MHCFEMLLMPVEILPLQFLLYSLISQIHYMMLITHFQFHPLLDYIAEIVYEKFEYIHLFQNY